MVRSYLPSLLGRDDDPFGSLFREVQKTFDDFSRRSPLAAFGSDVMTPKIDIAETKDAIDLAAELPGVDEKDRPRRDSCRWNTDHPGREENRA